MSGPWEQYAPQVEEAAPWLQFAPNGATEQPQDEQVDGGMASAPVAAGGSPAAPGTVPAAVRAAVGAAPTPQDRFATLQKLYPSAAITAQGDNFTIDDPQAGRMTYNPAGFDMGDLASLGPEAAQFVGGTIGAVMGAPAGPLGGAAGAGLGAAAGNELFQRYAQYVMGTADQRSLARQGADAMTMVATNAAGQAAGEMLGAVPRAIFKARMRGGRLGLEQYAQAVADADKWGVPISVGEAGDNAWRVFDNTAPKPAQRLKEKAAEAAGRNLAKLSTEISGGRGLTAERVGKTISDGIEEAGRRMRATGNALDAEFFRLVPKDSRVPMTNTLEAIKRVVPDMASMPATSQADRVGPLGRRMAYLAQDIADGQGALNLGDVRTFRRGIGEMIETGALVEDMPLIKLRDLHGALSADLKAAADTAGPAAQQAWAKSQAFWQRELRTMEDVLAPLVNKRVPSEVARALEGKMKNAPEYVREVMNTLTPKQRDLVRAATLRRLGYATPSGQNAAGDTWSFDRFLSDWNGLDRQTRNILFRNREYAGDLDALARTAERMHSTKSGSPVPNYAIAGAVGAAAASPLAVTTGGLGGWLMLPAGFALTAMGAQGGQRMMRNPAFVHWLARATTTSANGVGAHMGRLTAIANNSDAQTREDIAAFMEHLAE